MAILARPGFVSIAAASAIAPAASAASAASVGCARTEAERAADKARLTALYAEHGARIHRFLRRLLREDVSLAADATQETFVRAYRKLTELDPSARVLPWLFGIARNVSLELRKARYRAGKHVLASVTPPDPPAPGTPEADYLGREALSIVSSALDALPEERRAMLLLRLDHGLSYEDIATTMNFSLAKVKVEIFRAREVLRDAMTAYEQGGAR